MPSAFGNVCVRVCVHVCVHVRVCVCAAFRRDFDCVCMHFAGMNVSVRIFFSPTRLNFCVCMCVCMHMCALVRFCVIRLD